MDRLGAADPRFGTDAACPISEARDESEVLADVALGITQPASRPARRYGYPVRHHRDIVCEKGGILKPIDLNRPTQGAVRALLEQPAVFYPGSGKDLHPIEIFGSTREASLFVGADYLVSPDFGALNLRSGFHVVAQHDLNFQELCDLLEADQQHPCGERWTRFADWNAINGGTSRWVVFQESEAGQDQEPRRVGLLHVFGEAVWAYWHLWAKRNAAPSAILLQDHGFGGNWAPFGGGDAPLYRVAERAALPASLVVAGNTAVWPGYAPVRPVGGGGMHNHDRTLYRRC